MKGESIIKGSSQPNSKGQLIKKSSDVFFKDPGRRPVSIFILVVRKLSSKGQLNNKRQPNNKGQRNNTGQLIRKSTDIFFEIPAEGREVSIVILHWRKLNSKGQLNDERQLNNTGQLNSKGQLVKKSSDFF